MKGKVNLLFAGALVVLDAAMIALAFFLAYDLRLRTEVRPAINIAPFRSYLGMMVIQIVTLLLIFFFYKLYHRKPGASRIDQLYTVTTAVSIGIIMAIAFTGLIYKNELDYPRLMVIYAWLLTIVFVFVERSIYDTVRRSLYARGVGVVRALIVGAGEVGQMILRRIQESPRLGYRVVGFVDGGREGGEDGATGNEQVEDTKGAKVGNVPVLGTVEAIPHIIEAHDIGEVIIALPEASHQEILSIISRCQREKISIKVFPDVFQIMASEVNVGDLGGLPLLTVRDVALRGWKLTLKRAVDLVVSAAALVFLSPLMLLIAVLIKLDSPGPVLYVQERMGLDARSFPVIKFRSMRLGAEDRTGPVWASRDDPRRTRLGAFLRRFSLDELPQLVNVLLGEMSIVGPRPERPVFVEQFRQRIPRYMDRHWEKAGLTGWAQVNGLRGDTSIEERTKYDVYYVENWSLLFDFKIMLMTIVQFFKGENAY
jgi:Undecaprenyl-phosphate glucose phosphotransferase